MAFFLTADGGTESIRCRVYNETGVCLGQHSVPYETNFFSGGCAEQNPQDWWESFVIASKGAIHDANIDGQDILSICCATTSCSVVALDRDGNALRPALIWMDVRASQEAEMVLATGDDALKLNGDGQGPVSAEWMIPKALWIKRNEPKNFNRAYRICEYQDYMSYKLTGEWSASLNNVGLRWHYQSRNGGWPETLLETLGMGEILDKWPSQIVAPGNIIAGLSSWAAKELNLSNNVLVVQGGADALIGMIGLGVYKPGQLAMITGSSHLQFGVTETPLNAPGVWGAYRDIVYPNRWIVEGGQTSTGSILNWLSRIKGSPLDFDDLNSRATELEPGCNGLIIQDHFQGNRTPYTDPLSRGAITGLTLAHETHHLFRAIIEGIGFGTRVILDSFETAGYQSSEITIGGGAAASQLWLQIHADTSGLPVRVPESRDAPSTGCAVLGACGAGYFDDIDMGINAMIRPGISIDPIPQNVSRYAEIYPRYKALYPALKQALNI
jgi:ribulose kinase|tara:strand:- start:415 stop:1908 length:1494 start_codon:yes stop_codon:yes gene_type:complete